MKRVYVWVFVVLVVCMVAGFSVWSSMPQIVSAQEVKAGASTPPKLDEDDTLMLSTLASAGAMANTECQNLDSVKRYNAQRDRIVTRIEFKHPGYMIDWDKGVLVEKPKK